MREYKPQDLIINLNKFYYKISYYNKGEDRIDIAFPYIWKRDSNVLILPYHLIAMYNARDVHKYNGEVSKIKKIVINGCPEQELLFRVGDENIKVVLIKEE